MHEGVSAGKRDSTESQLPLQASGTQGCRKVWFPQHKPPSFREEEPALLGLC